MMFWMTSKVFQDIFLVNETDKNILDAQYVLVSTRIRKGDYKFKNIISAANILFPDSQVLSRMTDEDVRSAYFDQLEENKVFLATLIKGAIEEKYNIIFMSTKNENKLHYLKYLSEYIFMEFDYPVYEYKSYSNGRSSLIKYNKDKIIKKCNKLIKSSKEIQYQKDIKTNKGRERIKNEFSQLSKKEMKKNLKERDLYTPGMSKKEMLEVFELFL